MWRLLGLFNLFFCFLCVLNVHSTQASLPKNAVKTIEVSSLDGAYVIFVKTTGGFSYKSFLLPVKGKKEKLLVIDIWPVYLPEVKKRIKIADPQIKELKVSQFNKETVRLVLPLVKALPYMVRRDKNNLILSIHFPKPLRKKVCIKEIDIGYPPPQGLMVTVDATGEPYYKDFTLPPLLARGLPSRLVIDLWPAYLPKGMTKKSIDINHPFVSKLHFAQFDKQTVRLVLSLKTERIPYKIKFKENNLILTAFIPTVPEKPPFSLPQVLGLKIKKVVIDPGHGGKDPGAIGYKGLKEKDVNLRLAYLLKKKIETELGAKVILTRYTDKYLSLEERVDLANRHRTDLFISLHCNACPSHSLHGTETYFLGLTDDEYALAVAARENASLNRTRGELNDILYSLLAKAKVRESAYLAAEVQKNIIRHLKPKFNPIKDLGVKQAPFYVLIGTDMPAVLVETAFIDHPIEGNYLADGSYLNTLADGVLNGIRGFISTVEAYESSLVEAAKGG
jgi:N-acetylmuramoyl-L-alanine amidase